MMFNDEMRKRTIKMAINIYSVFQNKNVQYMDRSLIIQLIKSSSSVAAKFRAAARARSDSEYYSKICIVVEECDETQFWLFLFLNINLINRDEFNKLYPEVLELLKMFTSAKNKMKKKLAK